MITVDPGQYRAAKSVCRQWLAEVFFASYLLPKPRRMGAYCLAAVGRQIVEIAVPTPPHDKRGESSTRPVDNTGEAVSDCQSCQAGESDEQRRAVCLAVLDHLYAGKPTGKPELDGFSQVAQYLAIPREQWDRLVDGLIEQSAVRRYATWARMRDHLERTAGIAAQLGVRLFIDPSQRQAVYSSVHERVAAMGAGTGLTKILADLGNLGRHGRLMLPLDDLLKFELTEADVLRFIEMGTSGNDRRWRRLITFETARARNLIRGGAGALSSLEGDWARRAVAVVAAQYLGLLDQIERGDVFAHRPRTRPWHRLAQLPGAVRMAAAAG